MLAGLGKGLPQRPPRSSVVRSGHPRLSWGNCSLSCHSPTPRLPRSTFTVHGALSKDVIGVVDVAQCPEQGQCFLLPMLGEQLFGKRLGPRVAEAVPGKIVNLSAP